ncbi:hypothetical protein [Virgibacillus sp. Bac332]|uniref:hypothetical protein n=1 Tax=Virgibacillus sp. Bac332 TaxID=2419842 RepID=UPI000EF50112|nr:hypothetical protein [Virgibacillus sp. Bac332]
MKYRKKPVVIEAFKYGIDDMPEWFKEACRNNIITMISQYAGEARWCEIETLEGTMTANEGDYIIKGVNGEFYPCKPDIFKQTYELVD